MKYLTLNGSRIRFRPIALDDAYYLVRWRNSNSARESFFSADVVTPDSHAAFVRNRKPHDLVWMAETLEGDPVGMTSLTVDVHHHRAEYGRTFIDKDYRGQGYAKELEYMILFLAFEWLRLKDIWLDAYTANEPIIKLHEKTGWEHVAVNRPGHTDPRGDVLHMTYQRDRWKYWRDKFTNTFSVELPEWEEL